MKHKLVIFDLDGTLLDTLADLAAAVNAALAQNHMPGRTLTEVRQFVGNGIRKLIERAVPEGTAPEQTEQVLADFRAYYDAHCTDLTVPYEGIPELLEALRSEGVRMAVVSNKADSAVQKICAALLPEMDAIVGEREGIPRKPAPDGVQAVLKKLCPTFEPLAAHREDYGVGSLPQVVYVGDSDVDILTARNAGIPCISVSWGFRSAEFLREHGAETVVSTAEELLALLL